MPKITIQNFSNTLLYLLTDENGTRPLKTRAEIATQLVDKSETLDLVLNIFVASGLVLLLPESPADRYQLVHDYLVEFIRQQQGNELLEKLAKAEAELKQEQEAKKILEDAKKQADTEIAKGQKRLKWSSGLAIGLLIISGIASVYSTIQFKEADVAKQVTQLEQDGVDVLRQFQLEPLPSLINAVQNGKTLKTIVKNNPLDKYPTISPIYGLNHILENISERNIFKGHQSYVNSVSFSPDGKTIATASWDNIARLWPVRDLDTALKDGCAWLQDYLQNNVGLSEEDRRLCDDVK